MPRRSRQLVVEKSKGMVIEEKGETAPESNVIDLMEALRRSLGGQEETRPAKSSKSAATRTAPKKTASKTEPAKPAAKPAPAKRRA